MVTAAGGGPVSEAMEQEILDDMFAERASSCVARQGRRLHEVRGRPEVKQDDLRGKSLRPFRSFLSGEASSICSSSSNPTGMGSILSRSLFTCRASTKRRSERPLCWSCTDPGSASEESPRHSGLRGR